jgi:hypothetical protein
VILIHMVSVFSRSLNFTVLGILISFKLPCVKVMLSISDLVSVPKLFDRFRRDSVIKIFEQICRAIVSFVKIGFVLTRTSHEDQKQ